MVGLGETDEEIIEELKDMRAHNIDLLTIGQYLAPSNHHLPVQRYVHAGYLQALRERGAGDGIQRRCLRPDGTLKLLGGSAGTYGWRGCCEF